VKLRLVSACLVAAALTATGTADAATGVPGRESDPIVVTGEGVPALIGAQPGSIVAFDWDGGWHQVPVQVDERKIVDYPAVRAGNQSAGRPFTHLAYADPGTFAGADPDPALDADDEIAAMAFDAGDGVPDGTDDPAGVAAGSRVELRVVDSVDPGPTRFLYLFRSTGGLDPSAGRDYVDYDFNLLSGDYLSTYDFSGVAGGDSTQSGPSANPENTSVNTDYYRAHLGDRWIGDELQLRAGGATGVDILDGDKAQVNFGCGRSEVTFSRGGGGFIANIDGPVRAIRSYIGANSGTFTQRDQIYYQRSEVDSTYLRVHPGISTISQFLDYSAAATGMTYRNSAVPAGVTIDGTPDPAVETGTTPGTPFVWEQSTGPQGTLSIVTRAATTIPGINIGSYYEDTATPAAQQCVSYADDRTYGASGLAITNAGQNTDPTLDGTYGTHYDFTGVRTIFFSGPGGDAALAAKRSAQVDNPLQISLGNGGGGGGADEIRVRSEHVKSRAGIGKSKRLRVLITNGAETPVSGVELCPEGKRKLVRVGRCAELGDLAAGERRKASVRVRLRPRALTKKFVTVRVAVKAGGVEVNDARFRIRGH
jgi:hypothetical protein